ncbi:unnamed protein product [Ostreobium quekettii]|uniref:Uncharacterized protein n=1 Tax=Ostreobium quekettii TaxID=121088 RepID=A0A8S1IMH5_9CHLO|nr:unnamed protein product [Ostreobium quekettii]
MITDPALSLLGSKWNNERIESLESLWPTDAQLEAIRAHDSRHTMPLGGNMNGSPPEHFRNLRPGKPRKGSPRPGAHKGGRASVGVVGRLATDRALRSPPATTL